MLNHGTVRVAELPTGKKVADLSADSLRMGAQGVVWSPDGRSLIYAEDGHGEIVVVETEYWKEIARLKGHRRLVNALAISPDGRFLGGLILPGFGLMLKALESGTAGLHVPTGEVQRFPVNTSDGLMSGGTFAMAGAIERMHRHLERHCKASPVTLMTGGAGWKMAPSLSTPFELVENLIFDGLLRMARERFPQAPA